MRTPFHALYRVENWVVGKAPSFPKTASLVPLAIIVVFWFLVAAITMVVTPSASTAEWLQANWGWLSVGTFVLHLGYSFCRRLLDMKTADFEGSAR